MWGTCWTVDQGPAQRGVDNACAISAQMGIPIANNHRWALVRARNTVSGCTANRPGDRAVPKRVTLLIRRTTEQKPPLFSARNTSKQTCRSRQGTRLALRWGIQLRCRRYVPWRKFRSGNDMVRIWGSLTLHGIGLLWLHKNHPALPTDITDELPLRADPALDGEGNGTAFARPGGGTAASCIDSALAIGALVRIPKGTSVIDETTHSRVSTLTARAAEGEGGRAWMLCCWRAKQCRQATRAIPEKKKGSGEVIPCSTQNYRLAPIWRVTGAWHDQRAEVCMLNAISYRMCKDCKMKTERQPLEQKTGWSVGQGDVALNVVTGGGHIVLLAIQRPPRHRYGTWGGQVALAAGQEAAVAAHEKSGPEEQKGGGSNCDP